jgi:hypothetical protein
MTSLRNFAPLCVSIFSLLIAISSGAQAQSPVSNPPIGPGNVIVNPALGGTIFGFDIDQNGTEGLLSESLTLSNGNNVYATETFDQATGKILRIVRKAESNDGDSDVTWGVVGTSVGLVMHEHSVSFDHVANTYQQMNPLDGNQFTGPWDETNKAARVFAVSRNQGTPVNAFQIFDFEKQLEYVFGSNVAGNKFGPAIQITSAPGILGLNTKTNTAVLANPNGVFGPTLFTEANLATGKIDTEFLGTGSGNVQGLAVDSEDNIVATSTYGDSSVEFYDFTNESVIAYEVLPNCSTPACSAFDVEYDPIHKLFLVAQPISSLVDNESTIYVYDTAGSLQESLNGFNFTTQRFDVYPVHIALHPSERSGFVDVTNSTGVGAIQSFTY